MEFIEAVSYDPIFYLALSFQDSELQLTVTAARAAPSLPIPNQCNEVQQNSIKTMNTNTIARTILS